MPRSQKQIDRENAEKAYAAQKPSGRSPKRIAADKEAQKNALKNPKVMDFESFKAIKENANSRQDVYVLKSRSTKALENQQKYLIKSFYDVHSSSANGVISSYMREFIGANAANILIGDRAPEAFLIKRNPADTSSKVASKFITSFKDGKYFLDKHYSYQLPDKCLIGCAVDINGEIQIINKAGNQKKLSTVFKAIEDHEQVVFATGFIGQWDQHCSNIGVKIDSENAYTAIIDFDMAKIFEGDKLEYASSSIYKKIYNFYFIYDREKFLTAINKALESNELLKTLVLQAENDKFYNDFINKIQILAEEKKCFELAKAFKNNKLQEANKLISQINWDIIHKVSIQAIQEIADQIPKPVLSKGYNECIYSLSKHNFYKYAAVNADIKNGRDFSESIKKITDYSGEFIDTILSTAIIYNKIEFFKGNLAYKITSYSKTEALLTSIAFDKEEIFNILLKDYSIANADLSKALVYANNYGRDNYFDSILSEVDRLSGRDIANIFTKKIVDYDGNVGAKIAFSTSFYKVIPSLIINYSNTRNYKSALSHPFLSFL